MFKAMAFGALVACSSATAQGLERVEVVKVDSTRTAAELYRTAERWFVDAFKDAQEVVQLRDTVSHTLVGKGRGTATYVITKPAFASAPWPYAYSLEVQTKDGRYRVRVYDVVWGEGGAPILDRPCCSLGCDIEPTTKTEQKTWERTLPGLLSVCEQVRGRMSDIVASLNKAMAAAKDDW